jgi:tetratricopeptide (TPR) repeat protein
LSGTVQLSDLAIQMTPGHRWAMIRHHFGIEAFGINAHIADEPGTTIITEHDEGQDGHEELYFVASGHATFTVEGDEIDAPAGTFVFVRDSAAKRTATADEAGTTIVIAGAKAGEAFTPSNWERQAPALVHFSAKEYDKALEVLQVLLAETPEDAAVLYNLACAESMRGNRKEALDYLSRSLAKDSQYRELAEKDSDLDGIRGDPAFVSAVAGQVDAGSKSS